MVDRMSDALEGLFGEDSALAKQSNRPSRVSRAKGAVRKYGKSLPKRAKRALKTKLKSDARMLIQARDVIRDPSKATDIDWLWQQVHEPQFVEVGREFVRPEDELSGAFGVQDTIVGEYVNLMAASLDNEGGFYHEYQDYARDLYEQMTAAEKKQADQGVAQIIADLERMEYGYDGLAGMFGASEDSHNQIQYEAMQLHKVVRNMENRKDVKTSPSSNYLRTVNEHLRNAFDALRKGWTNSAVFHLSNACMTYGLFLGRTWKHGVIPRAAWP